MKVNLLLFVLLFNSFIHTIYGNTEKLILQVRETDSIPCDEKILQLQKYKSASTLAAPFTEVQSTLIPRSKANKTTADWYQLDELNEGSNYEIRISYPAITPADFELNIINRCVLDGRYSYLLQVTANYTGVSQIEGIDHQPVTYNIVLENLYFGFLFYQVYKIVIAIVVVIALGLFVFIPYVKNLIIDKTSKIE